MWLTLAMLAIGVSGPDVAAALIAAPERVPWFGPPTTVSNAMREHGFEDCSPDDNLKRMLDGAPNPQQRHGYLLCNLGRLQWGMSYAWNIELSAPEVWFHYLRFVGEKDCNRFVEAAISAGYTYRLTNSTSTSSSLSKKTPSGVEVRLAPDCRDKTPDILITPPRPTTTY